MAGGRAYRLLVASLSRNARGTETAWLATGKPGPGKPRAHQSGRPGKLKGLRRVRAHPAAIWMTWRRAASESPPAPRSVVWGDEAAAPDFLLCCLPAAGRQRGFQQDVPPCYPAYPGEDACVTSQPGAEPGTARCGPAIGRVIAVAGAAGSGTASARRARAAYSRQLAGRSPEVAPGAAAPGLTHRPELAAAGGGIGAAMGLNDPADPGGDSDAIEIGGPLPAAAVEMAHSGSAHDEPRAPQEAAGEQAPARTSRWFPAMTTRTFPPPG